ncbi:MAG: zinc-binding dehydrogenase [Kiritimatiellaeota bacterium]|nr:zinc-binding dehydrogenase [Kiritimatiellota bacterium]
MSPVKTMKALQFEAPGHVAWKDVEVPTPGTGEVLVRIEAVDTCPHWDLHILEGQPMFPGQKLIYPYTLGQPGHEAVGEVVAVGDGVDPQCVGRRVAAWRDQGHSRQGCYAQFNTFGADNVLEVPGEVRAERVASLELAMCVQVVFDRLMQFGAVREACLGVGGLGGAGLIAVQMAKAYGAREVVGFDPLPERRDLAVQLGADRVTGPGTADVLGPGERLDTAIDCTGLKVVIEDLMDKTRNAVALFGVNRQDVSYGWRHRSLALLGYGSHNRRAAERALRLILDGKLDLVPLVSARLPLARYAEGVEMLRQKQAIKIMYLPWADA